MNKRVILKPKRSISVRRKHPWIFSGAIQSVQGGPDFGDTVAVFEDSGEFLAWGHYSPHSQIRVRLFSWDQALSDENNSFWRDRLAQSIHARLRILANGETTACRLVNAENDGIPGLVVDRYQDVLVVQILNAGMEIRKQMLVETLWEMVSPEAIYERSDVDVRQKEGLSDQTGLLMGTLPPQPLEFLENGLRFLVDVPQGHKSGFYLDQRQNRHLLGCLVRDLVRAEIKPRLLNVFSFTGGFTVYGLHGGAASAVNVDTSQQALELGRHILERNHLPLHQVCDIAEDAFQALRKLRSHGEHFDIIVLDPPKFAASQKDIHRASRGYKDINMQAMHVLAPGGILLTFSCSGAVSEDLFQKIVFGAAQDAGRDLQIIGKMSQADDHPVALTFPEGAYLKGLLCRCTS